MVHWKKSSRLSTSVCLSLDKTAVMHLTYDQRLVVSLNNTKRNINKQTKTKYELTYQQKWIKGDQKRIEELKK
jgi:protein tyrosine/serine phosphatase